MLQPAKKQVVAVEEHGVDEGVLEGHRGDVDEGVAAVVAHQEEDVPDAVVPGGRDGEAVVADSQIEEVPRAPRQDFADGVAAVEALPKTIGGADGAGADEQMIRIGRVHPDGTGETAREFVLNGDVGAAAVVGGAQAVDAGEEDPPARLLFQEEEHHGAKSPPRIVVALKARAMTACYQVAPRLRGPSKATRNGLAERPRGTAPEASSPCAPTSTKGILPRC